MLGALGPAFFPAANVSCYQNTLVQGHAFQKNGSDGNFDGTTVVVVTTTSATTTTSNTSSKVKSVQMTKFPRFVTYLGFPLLLFSSLSLSFLSHFL